MQADKKVVKIILFVLGFKRTPNDLKSNKDKTFIYKDSPNPGSSFSIFAIRLARFSIVPGI